MRELTDKEKELLKQLVILKKQHKLGELQAGKFLKNELSCFALKWQTIPKVQLTLYVKSFKSNLEEDVPQAYFDISDFVYFIKELHINNYIELQTVQNKDKGNELVDDSLMLYDRDIYEYKNDVDEFWTKGNETQFMGEKYTMKAHVNIKHKSIVYLDIVQTLNKYANAIIYPLPRLIDYVENGYKTIEQRRFEWQKKLTWISIFVAIAIGVLSPIITHCLSNRVEPNFDNNLKGAETVVESDSSTQTVHFVQFDTLDIKVLAPRTQLKLGINSNQ